MILREKFLEKAFCMCEDESQIDNFIDVADEFAIGFAEWIDEIRTLDNGVYALNSYEELLEIYKKEQYGK